MYAGEKKIKHDWVEKKRSQAGASQYDVNIDTKFVQPTLVKL